MQRYQSAAGRHHCDEDGHKGQSDTLVSDPYGCHDQPSQSVKHKASEQEIHGSTNGVIGIDRKEEDRMRGDGSNAQARKDSQSQTKTEANHAVISVENAKQESTGVTKPAKKVRKPDREIYQPGNRRNIQGKDCEVGRDREPKNPKQKTEPESQLCRVDSEGSKKTSVQKQSGKDKEIKCVLSEAGRKQGSQDVEKHPLPSDCSVEKITNKVEKLSMNEKFNTGVEGQVVEELSCKIGEMAAKERRRNKEEDEKAEKKRERGNRRRREGDKEKENNLDSKRKQDKIGGRGKSDSGKAEKERNDRAADKDNKPRKKGETHQRNGREKCRENRRGDNNRRSTDTVADVKTQRNADTTVDGGNRKQPSSNNPTPTSKRYSKSDIRRSRNRTYSSSSTSSVTSLDGSGLGMDVKNAKWPHLEPRHKGRMANSGEGRRGHLQSWTTNGESSTESLEGSELSDIADDRRRRTGEEEVRIEKHREERSKPKGNKGGCRGVLHVSLERQLGTSSQSGFAQHSGKGVAPQGRGGGILVLPSRADISKSSETGQRLLFGNRGGTAASKSRGGRGGGVRRLWDPNNPDQKPALTSTHSSQHSSLQHPTYLQTGAGYGQLHFLDTDDEIAGSPPVPQSEHFQSKQAAAMAYYKFQNSDNPYCYPHNPSTGTSQRYQYPYHIGPHQIAPTNSMYAGPGMGQFCGSYRGVGYSQSGSGGALTFEEVEQQARGELVRLLRAADAQELQISNLLSRDRVSAEGLDRMAHLR